MKQFKKQKNKMLIFLLALLFPVQAGYAHSNEENIKVEKEITDENDYYKDMNSEYLKTLEFFDTFEPTYYYEEHLLTEDEIDEIISSSLNSTECTFIFDGDIDAIMDIIKRNSLEYIKEHPEFVSAFIDGASLSSLFSDQYEFETYFEVALNQIVDKNTNNIDEDFHRIKDLKVVYNDRTLDYNLEERYHAIYKDDSDYFILGYYDDVDNAIILNRDMIRISAVFDDQSFEEVLYCTLVHELNHLRQHKCECRKDDTYQTISYQSEYQTSLLESSAESEIYNLDKDSVLYQENPYNYTYPYERNCESLLLLLALTNEDATIDDYYNAIFDVDIEAFFEFFNIHTEEDKHKLYNVLYIIDGLNFRADLPFNIYTDAEMDEKTLFDFQHDIGYAYRNEIFAMALYNLVDYTISHTDFTFEENMMLFNIIKNKIAEESYILVEEFDSENNPIYVRKYDQKFIEQAVKLENKYIEFMLTYYDVSEETMKKTEDEIFLFGVTLTTIAIEEEMAFEKYIDPANQLLEKFPILKPILYSNSFYRSYYNEMLEKNPSLTLEKIED